VRGKIKTLRSIKGQRVRVHTKRKKKPLSSLSRLFLFWIKKRHFLVRRQRPKTHDVFCSKKMGPNDHKGSKKRRERKKKGFLFPTRAALYVNYAPLSLSLSIDNKKKLRRRRRVKQSARGSFFFDVHLQFASVRLHQHLVSLRGHFQALQAVGGRRTQRDRRAGGFNATNARSSGGDSGVS